MKHEANGVSMCDVFRMTTTHPNQREKASIPVIQLPPLVGLCDFDEASVEGLSVEDGVKRLKRFHFAFWRLHQICIAHIASEPLYELKMAYSMHAHYAAECDTQFRTRIGEMREPPLGLEKCPHPALGMFFDEIQATPSSAERVVALYEVAFPALRAALEQTIKETHPLADAPSIRICRHVLLDLETVQDWGAKAAAEFRKSEKIDAGWLTLLEVCLAAAGGLDGSQAGSGNLNAPVRHYSSKPFEFDPVPRRDSRFPDPFNMGVNAEVFLYDEEMPANAKVLMMLYKRIREIDVPEMMSSILHETTDKPWDFHRDMTRQLWDEARHAMMGEVGFHALGMDWPNLVMVNSTWSTALNTQLTPSERHAVLYFIEQGLMPKTGKRHEWEVATAAGHPLAKTFQDFDWADEVLHARIGRDWYVAFQPSAREAVANGDQCWSKVCMGWQRLADEGLTEHRNWWPELYAAWCESSGTAPDPRALEFHETYESTRPDLKEVTA